MRPALPASNSQWRTAVSYSYMKIPRDAWAVINQEIYRPLDAALYMHTGNIRSIL